MVRLWGFISRHFGMVAFLGAIAVAILIAVYGCQGLPGAGSTGGSVIMWNPPTADSDGDPLPESARIRGLVYAFEVGGGHRVLAIGKTFKSRWTFDHNAGLDVVFGLKLELIINNIIVGESAMHYSNALDVLREPSRGGRYYFNTPRIKNFLKPGAVVPGYTFRLVDN